LVFHANMINDEDTAQRFLLATSPSSKDIKDNILKDIILKIVESQPLTAPHLRERLAEEYNISIDKIFFQEYMDDLKKKGFLKTSMDKFGRILYLTDEQSYKIIKDSETHLAEIMGKYSEEIRRRIPHALDREYNENEKGIFFDFIEQYSMEIDNNYYNAIVYGMQPPTIHNMNFECKVDKLSDDLKSNLNDIYKDILNFLDEDFKNQLTAICIFWSTFNRISSLETVYKNRMLDEIQKTRIFADTNTLIAYCCRYDIHHEVTFDCYNSIMENLDIKIYYTERTKEELSGKLKSASQIINSMQYFPERARYWAKKLNDGIVQTYIFGDYISWEFFEEDIWENINSSFKLCSQEEINKLGITSSDINKEGYRIKSVLDIKSEENRSIKWEDIQKHDRYLITFVNCVREKEARDDWFKYTSWIATLDRTMANLDKSIFSSPEAPDAPNISLLIKYFPLYFHPFYFLKSLSSVKDAYNLLYFCNYEIGENIQYREKLKKEIISLGRVKDKQEFDKRFKDNLNKLDERFLMYAKNLVDDNNNSEVM
jgi:hypothetical protein